MAEKDCFQSKRIDQIEERLRETEQGLASLTSNLEIINENFKEDIERTRLDLRERMSDLKTDMKEDFDQVDSSLADITSTVNALNDSLQNLYITQTGSNVKVKFNEKVIWAIVTAVGIVALYYIQEIIKVGGAG